MAASGPVTLRVRSAKRKDQAMKVKQFPKGGAKQPPRQEAKHETKDGDVTIISLQVRMPPAAFDYAQKRARHDGQSGVQAYLMTLLREALDQDWRYAMEREEAAHFRKKCMGGR
jgi:hypothetical protein